MVAGVEADIIDPLHDLRQRAVRQGFGQRADLAGDPVLDVEIWAGLVSHRPPPVVSETMRAFGYRAVSNAPQRRPVLAFLCTCCGRPPALNPIRSFRFAAPPPRNPPTRRTRARYNARPPR